MQVRLGRHTILLLMPFFISACGSSPRGLIILCAGDSLTSKAYPHDLQKIFNKEGIKAKVLNYGRAGNTSREYLNFLERNKERLKKEEPDFILLQLGTNDVRTDSDQTPTAVFKDNMKKIVGIFRASRSRAGLVPKILLALIPPVPKATPFPFTPDSARRVAEEINPAIQDICEQENIALVDNYAIFLKEPSLLPGVHPTREGFKLLARNWYQALKPYLNR
jgi:lysophospholipase L1-like esterase